MAEPCLDGPLDIYGMRMVKRLDMADMNSRRDRRNRSMDTLVLRGSRRLRTSPGRRATNTRLYRIFYPVPGRTRNPCPDRTMDSSNLRILLRTIRGPPFLLSNAFLFFTSDVCLSNYVHCHIFKHSSANLSPTDFVSRCQRRKDFYIVLMHDIAVEED
jgi:hypothetical protein